MSLTSQEEIGHVGRDCEDHHEDVMRMLSGKWSHGIQVYLDVTDTCWSSHNAVIVTGNRP